MPIPHVSADGVRLTTPARIATAEIAAYRDELFAYMMFNHLRNRPSLHGMQLLLTYHRDDNGTPYRLVLRGHTDLLRAIADMERATVTGHFNPPAWRLIPEATAAYYSKQTDLFISAYNMPIRRKLETLPPNAIAKYLRRFIRFKSSTDPRILLRMEPAPKALSDEDASTLAADIITVAEFYALPLEFLLGIGGMENNYMNVRGDLNHTIWKRKPAPDDIVVERKRGRVRVLNDSAGVWQITRETLRYAHRLYRADKRDYSLLPEALRPPLDLRIDEISPRVLTTYAGLILRDLLDRFDGDVTLAVSAYNGGPGRPNLRYGEGVHRVAAHARRVIEQSAALNGESVMNTTWIRSR